MGISLQLGHYSSFIIHNSSIPFRIDEVMMGLSAVVGKIRELTFQ
jgi:hypothetical protein